MFTAWSRLIAAVSTLSALTLADGGSAQIATDGTVGPRVSLAGPDFTIGAGLAARVGGNLFHSFERFSVGTGESATFTGPSAIRNVVSRVTGGERSAIDGGLRSTMPNADFYFINPAGILFGPNAALDLPGSLHISTADELQFSDGAVFSASDPAASSLTLAPPEAFGFVGGTSGGIVIERSFLRLPFGERLSIVGGDILITGGPAGSVFTEGGQIALVASGSPGRVSIADPGRAGARGESIVLADQAFVGTSLRVDPDDDDAPIAGGGGTVVIRGGRLAISGGSAVAAFTLASGDSGNLDIQVAELVVDNGALRTDTFGAGGAGDLLIIAASVELTAGGAISSSTFGAGDAGRIILLADRLHIDGANADLFTGLASRVSAEAGGSGGSIDVAARTIEIEASGRVSSATLGFGDAGTVRIAAERLSISGAGTSRFTGIASDVSVGAIGNGGSVDVRANAIEITDGGRISSSTAGVGDAGDVRIGAGTIRVANGAALAAVNVGGGRGGDIEIDARRLSLKGASLSSQAAGEGGRVVLHVRELIDLQDSRILTSVVDPANLGTAVDIAVDGSFLVLDGSVIEISNPDGPIRLSLRADWIVQTPDSALRINGKITDLGPTENLTALQVMPEATTAAAPLRTRCAGRRDVGASSFVGAGRGGLPPDPDRPLPSAYRQVPQDAVPASANRASAVRLWCRDSS